MFHVDAGGGVACASCHPEGGEDGRVWNFTCLGPRRSQSLRGGLSGTEPFHWDGDMPDFSTLVQTVFVGRMSGPQPSRRPDRGDAALARHHPASCRRPRPPRRRPSSAAARCSRAPPSAAPPATRARASRTTSPSTSARASRRSGAFAAGRWLARAVPAHGLRAHAGRPLRLAAAAATSTATPRSSAPATSPI